MKYLVTIEARVLTHLTVDADDPEEAAEVALQDLTISDAEIDDVVDTEILAVDPVEDDE